jgi:hypothetical protein
MVKGIRIQDCKLHDLRLYSVQDIKSLADQEGFGQFDPHNQYQGHVHYHVTHST